MPTTCLPFPLPLLLYPILMLPFSVFLCNMLQILVTANIVPSLRTVVTLMIVLIHSSEMSVLTRATWCSILENGILEESLSYERF
jgi:hypothetical protein